MDDRTVPLDWNDLLLDQLEWQWEHLTRPRLDGLTDEEYRWEPVPGWSVRPRGEAASSMADGGGDLVIDFELPAPEPAPVTTIAWRLGHVIAGVLGARTALHFGGPPIDPITHHYAATADEALAQLDEQHVAWVAGVRSLGTDGLARAAGDGEGFPDSPMAGLVLHIHRECLHHLAEVALLRDLWANGVR